MLNHFVQLGCQLACFEHQFHFILVIHVYCDLKTGDIKSLKFQMLESMEYNVACV